MGFLLFICGFACGFLLLAALVTDLKDTHDLIDGKWIERENDILDS